jgi:tRNA G18 (ribose-2'-O)-methylase SpoU
MPIIRIDQFDDPRIQQYRNVSDRQLLLRQNLFVAEGRLVVARLLEGGYAIVSLLLNEASLRALGMPLAAISADVPIYVCETAEFASITGFTLHRGCLALAQRPHARSAPDIIENANLLVVLEGVADPDNIGSVFRNAAAFGADGVLLSPTCCDPLYRKAIRTSMGAVLRVAYARLENWPSDLALLTTHGFTLMALTPKAAIDLNTCARPRRTALLVGSEGPGLTTRVEAMADSAVRISIRDGVDSLNLATATGIALHYFGRGL